MSRDTVPSFTRPLSLPVCACPRKVDLKASQAMRSRLKGVIDHHAVSEHMATAGRAPPYRMRNKRITFSFLSNGHQHI